MRYSRYFIPTVREVPAEAEIASHRLMIRAGMIRKIAAGVYDILPLGLRVLRKVENIVRREMDRAGGLETFLPSMVPAELWSETGRWELYGKELLRIKDRHGHEFCYGPTHEEVMTDLVRREVKSYKQLPITLYQIQTKFRDEIRPRFGVMRAREFMMKDAYSFHADEDDAAKGYERMFRAYEAVFNGAGLKFRAVEADTGNIGGNSSHEFMVLAATGEDLIVSCAACSYASNVEKTEVLAPEPPPPSADPAPMRPVETPTQRTIEEVAAFLKLPPERFIKTLVYAVDGGREHVCALVRGDHEVNEFKLKRILDAATLELATPEKVRELCGAAPGFVGPHGLNLRIVGDNGVRGMSDAASGANRDGHHVLGVAEGRDFGVSEYHDIRKVKEGDACPRCKKGALEFHRGIEVGHVFRLGTKYSKAMKAVYLDANGREQVMVMGTYGIGVGRIAAAAIEQSNDANGIIWPWAIAPFHVAVLPLNMSKADIASAASALEEELSSAGYEVLLDDRDERAGLKFNDADLIGIPVQVIVGEKGLKNGEVELKIRKTGERLNVKLGQVKEKMKEIAALLSAG